MGISWVEMSITGPGSNPGPVKLRVTVRFRGSLAEHTTTHNIYTNDIEKMLDRMIKAATTDDRDSVCL